VSAFGSSSDEQRTHKQVLKHLVKKVLDAEYEVIRADQIDDEGLITNQVIEHLLDDDLVVADLTGLNPNVFYEIAVRHAARKPIIHLITKGQEIPFDVANMRAVPYALDDPDALEDAQDELRRKVDAIEAEDFKAAPNPVSAARDIWLLRESEQPDIRQVGNVLAAVNELRDEMRALTRRSNSSSDLRGSLSSNEVLEELRKIGPMDTESLAANLYVSPGLAQTVVASLLKEGEVLRREDGLWEAAIPF
jgi:hypothetical protein